MELSGDLLLLKIQAMGDWGRDFRGSASGGTAYDGVAAGVNVVIKKLSRRCSYQEDTIIKVQHVVIKRNAITVIVQNNAAPFTHCRTREFRLSILMTCATH